MRTSLQDLRSVGDPLQQYSWDLIIPNVPGSGDGRALTFKAMSTSIPGEMLEEVAVRIKGLELRYAGTANWSHQWQVTFLETRDIGTRDILQKWRKTARDWVTNSGSYKAIYSRTIQLVLYDDIPQEVRTINMFGAWPQTIDDAAVDGATSGAVTVGCTFSYDLTDDEEN
jgi:hypothetical protein